MIDKEGHIKLSDFGLSTGFHKQHDSSYYTRLLESANGVASPTTAAQSARNSVMVNAIHLTMSNKDTIATWKANRRKLVSTNIALDDVELTDTQIDRRIPPSVHPITSLPRSSFKKVTGTSVIGGPWGRLCSNVSSDILHSAQRRRMKHTRRSLTGRTISSSQMTFILVARLKTSSDGMLSP